MARYWGLVDPPNRGILDYLPSINSSKLLQPTPPPTTRLRPVCVGSGLTVEFAPLEAADARHGGDSCVLWELLGWDYIP